MINSKNVTDGLLAVADLDLFPEKSACDTWGSATVSFTPQTILPLEPTALPGTGIQIGDSVFHLCDLFTSLTLTQPSAAIEAFGTRSKAYVIVSMAIYLLSNNLVDPYHTYPHGHFLKTLDSVFAEIPARHLRVLLQSRLANVRAAFEALLRISGVLKQPFAFKSLVDIGIGNNWLSNYAHGHEALYHAVDMNLDEVVQLLLENGCRPDMLVETRTSGDHYTTPVVTALRRRNFQCVQLLLKHCHVNGLLGSQFQIRYTGLTSFTFFIQKSCHFDEMLFGQGIKLFLDAGADINSLLRETTEVLDPCCPLSCDITEAGPS